MPGERADVLVIPDGEAPSEVALRWLPYDRGYGTAVFRDPEDVLAIELEAPAGESPVLPRVGREIAPLELAGATKVDLELTMTQTGPDEKIVLGINGVPFPDAEPLHGRVGETQHWNFVNETEWDHPIDLHGFFFQELDAHGAPREPLGWKDTVNVPANGAARFVVRYDDCPGMWMFHCHILDHADLGMMGMLMLHGR